MPPESSEPVAPVSAPETKKTPWGSLIGIVLIVIILVAGAFYVWQERLAQDRAQEQAALPVQ